MIKMLSNSVTFICSRLIHLLQILKRRVPSPFGIWSNFILFLQLNSLKLWSFELPKLSRLVRLTRYLGREISWEDLIAFLKSESEIDQEFIAFLLCGVNGYFVEFGALDGKRGSNTFILEDKFNWRGVLAEAIPEMADECVKNRKSPCFRGAIVGVETHRKASKINQQEDLYLLNTNADNDDKLRFEFGEICYVEFAEIIDPSWVGLSTMENYINADRHFITRQNGYIKRIVPAILLDDLLAKYDAPKQIDFLSIDTEGSELEILSSLNFEKYCFRFITVEHNNSVNKEAIIELLESQGYQRILPRFSGGDAWFIPSANRGGA